MTFCVLSIEPSKYLQPLIPFTRPMLHPLICNPNSIMSYFFLKSCTPVHRGFIALCVKRSHDCFISKSLCITTRPCSGGAMLSKTYSLPSILSWWPGRFYLRLIYLWWNISVQWNFLISMMAFCDYMGRNLIFYYAHYLLG